MPSPRPEAPALVIVAGPNGSGKSSAYQDANVDAFGRSVWIINPDLLTARIVAIENLSIENANIAAVCRIEAWLEASIEAHQTVGVETVLSTSKYRRLVEKAKALGFVTWLIYVILDEPRRNVERVRLRVMKGGHDVPEAKTLSRHARSLRQTPWFLEQADQAWLYDNSGESPRLVGQKQNGVVTIDHAAPQAILDAVASLPPN